MKRRVISNLIILVLVLIITACGDENIPLPSSTSMPTASETLSPKQAYLPTYQTKMTQRFTEEIVSQLTQTAENTPTAIVPEIRATDQEFQEDSVQSTPLSSTGPWLVYSESWNEEGLEPFYMMNLGGGGKTHLFSIRTHTFLQSRYCNLSPDNKYLSCQSMRDIDSVMGLEKEIVIAYLPDQQVVAKIPAVSADIVDGLRAIGDPNHLGDDFLKYMYSDEFTAIKASGQMVWSPDSRYLAYVAAVDGPTSDVYVFDTVTQQTKRLTNGLTQASIMAWSPDSRWVIHFSWYKGPDDIDNSALPAVNAIWAANPEFGTIVKLADVEWDSIREWVLGWVSEDEFFVISDEAAGIGSPFSHLRLINITTNTNAMWLEDRVDDVAIDPVTQNIMFLQDNYSLEPPSVWLQTRNGAAVKIDDREWDSIYWIPEISWLVFLNWIDDNVQCFSAEGTQIERYLLENSAPPEVSPNGEFLVFTGGNRAGQIGIRIYNNQGELLDRIYTRDYFTEGKFYWESDSSGFWFIEERDGFPNYGYIIEYTISDKTIIQWHTIPDENLNVDTIVGLVIP